jgi:hypothetical protein
MRLDVGAHERHPRCSQALLFGGTPRHDLTSTRNERRQRLGLLVAQRAWGWTHRLAEMRQCLGIQPIRLGQASRRLGQVVPLAWVDHGDLESGHPELSHHWRFVAAGRLNHHYTGLQTLQPRHDGGNPRRIIGHPSRFPARTNRHSERRLSPIEANGRLLRLVPMPSSLLSTSSCHPWRPGLARYGLSSGLALATVRAHSGEGTRRPKLFCGLKGPRDERPIASS